MFFVRFIRKEWQKWERRYNSSTHPTNNWQKEGIWQSHSLQFKAKTSLSPLSDMFVE